jgi:hypothetical protein
MCAAGFSSARRSNARLIFQGNLRPAHIAFGAMPAGENLNSDRENGLIDTQLNSGGRKYRAQRLWAWAGVCDLAPGYAL